MNSSFEEVGLVGYSHSSLGRHTRHLVMIASLAAVFIFRTNVNGQSSEWIQETPKTDSVRQALRSQVSKNGDLAFYESHSFLQKSRIFSQTGSIDTPSGSEQRKEEDQSLIQMNHKLDSAWKKFDQRCREHDRHSNPP